ncbi:alpha/beta fold hydrolase [uncultured Roseibium sp.]|uniref:lipase family alpha/beta hydrolase n=1 Tax=uncultured Roseibium sp. TaxID=1936171 RepID=UPI003216AA86
MKANCAKSLGDATYEELRGLGAELGAGTPVPAAPAGVSPQEVFGLGKPRKAIYILPGIMGSKLSVKSDLRDNLIWFDPASIVLGQVDKLKFRPGKDNVFASGVFWAAYGWLRLKLSVAGYKTRFLPFDWRYPTVELGDALYKQIVADGDSDVTLIAHSMGGLVARQIAKLDASTKKISRVITLGTPNNGSYSPVQVFRNVHSMVTKLDRLDPIHSAEDIIQDVLRDFPGLVEMMAGPEAATGGEFFRSRELAQLRNAAGAEGALDAALEAHNDLPLPDERFHQIIGIGEENDRRG